MKKKIIIGLCLIIGLGLVFGIVDYNKIQNLEEPIFMIRVTTGSGTNQHYIGIGYRMKREVSVSYTEPYYMDNEIRFGLWLYTWKLKFKAAIDYLYTINVEKSNNCNKNLYYSEEDRDIYLYCLESVKVNTGETKLELIDYLNSEDKTIDEFINLFLISDSFNDGSKLYKGLGDTENANGFTDNGLAILECNTRDGNKDIYLGPIDMKYEEEFCKFDNDKKELKTFIRTYNVNSIHLDDDENYIYLTLKQFQGETATVHVLKSIASNVKMGYNYEFKFEYLDNNFEDNMNSIFENTTLLEIKETDKVGLEQIQDEIK